MLPFHSARLQTSTATQTRCSTAALCQYAWLRGRINYDTPEAREAAGRSAISVRPKGHPVSTVRYAQTARKTTHLNGSYNYERDYEVTQTEKVKGNPSIMNGDSLSWDCQTD